MSNVRDLWYDWLGLNTWLFGKINALSDLPMYSDLMKFVTLFGDKKILPYMLFAIAVFAFTTMVMRMVMKKGGSVSYLFIWINIALMISSGLYVNDKISNYIKTTAAYPRPYAALPAGRVRLLEALPPAEAVRSFPSGHATVITVLVFSLWIVLNETFRWIGILLVFFVSWSRVSLGVHFPMDVISGFVIAFTVMSIISYILSGITRTIRLTLKI